MVLFASGFIVGVIACGAAIMWLETGVGPWK